jgi:hypothetical protein
MKILNMGSLNSEIRPLHTVNKGISLGKRLLPQVLDKLAAECPNHTIGIMATPIIPDYASAVFYPAEQLKTGKFFLFYLTLTQRVAGQKSI